VGGGDEIGASRCHHRVTTARPRQVEIAASAKLNLGLEILGRRPDGYHELATIFLAVDLLDRLTLTAAADLTLICDDPSLPTTDNLAPRAVAALRQETGYRGGAHVALTKAIPAASGMGGASSDAAAALIAARDLWQLETSRRRLAEIAAALGSDVPFFLHGGCALGQGRGEIITPLPIPEDLSFVIVAPALTIPRKTATLFASLQPTDFSDGSRIFAQAARLRSGAPLDPAFLTNAFSRPLAALFPEIAELPSLMHKAGASTPAVTGAGPAHYAPVADPDEAKWIASRLRKSLGNKARVIVVRPYTVRPGIG
jgi:4-diphosphocytidyl-2-C-methyl-D-erythritol kinase